MEEVQRIRVGNTCVGLVGLKTVMAEASKKYGRSPAEDIGKQLVEALSMSNYIPQSGRALYEEALAREYLKQQGLVSDEADGDVLEIKVLGKGCPDCDRLMQIVMDVLEEMKINVDLEYVRSPVRIGQYGVMGTPALVVNNMVKAVGFVPPHEQIRDWVGEALKQ